MRYNEEGLFPVLEAALKAASEPLDCHSLFERPEIRSHAPTVNRVSDYLGHMWRKGQVVRLPAPKIGSSRARWLYQWKGEKGPAMHGVEYSPHILADRPTMLITEEGGAVKIELPNLIIVIQQKQPK